MNNKEIKAALSLISEDTVRDIAPLWELLPDFISGKEWVSEIVECADRMPDWVYNDNDSITLDELQDKASEYADNCCQDSYYSINRRVQELSLWAYDDLDIDVAEMSGDDEPKTINALNSTYLYCAMRGLFYVIAQWAFDKAAELEGANT